MFKKLLSKYFRRALQICLDENISFTYLHRKKILNFLFEKTFNDKAKIVHNKNEYFKMSCDYIKKFENRINLEFGIGTGGTAKIFSENLNNCKIYGFDSFDGFMHDPDVKTFWFSFQKTFKQRKKPSLSLPNNYEIIEGFVENTVPNFDKEILSKLNYDYIFAHIDVDVYEPTKVILKTICSKRKKSFLMFDEFTNYDDFEKHEWRAFYEEVICNEIPYKIKFVSNAGSDHFGHLSKYFIEIY